MTRREQAFALVTDEGVTPETVSAAIGISSVKARQYLWELVKLGQVFCARIGHTTNHYFLTAEAAAAYKAQDRGARVLAAIPASGATAKEIAATAHMCKEATQAVIHNLLKTGRVFSGRVGHRTCRYFKTKEGAEAFAKRGVLTSAFPSTVHLKPVTIKTSFEKGAQIVIPQGVKVQECPPFKGLGFSETQPKERAFSSLGVGRYLPDEDAMLRRVARKGAA